MLRTDYLLNSCRRVRELNQIEIERAKAEKALKRSEERFRLLYERAPLGYQSLDINGNFVEVNQAWLDTLGYAREEVMGKFFGDFLSPDWSDHFKKYFPRFKTAGEILGVEFEMLRKDGSKILVSFHGKIGEDHKGNFKQTHCILYDITDRRQAEEKLLESETELNVCYENAPLVMLLVDRERRVIKMNAAAVSMAMRSAEKSIGLRGGEALRCAHASDDLKGCGFGPACESCGVRNTVIKTFQSGNRFHRVEAIIPYAHPDGTVDMHVLVSSAPLTVLEKHRVLVCIEDITERKKVEETLLKERNNLQKALAEIKTLKGLLPICASCKKIRDDEGHWRRIESYIEGRSDAEFSHGICPECAKKLYPDLDIHDD